jgi:nucleoside-diphosphate-sugar epimerase
VEGKNMTKTVLILGAAGRIGAALVAAFSQAGWNVIAQQRKPAAATSQKNVRVVTHPLDQVEVFAREIMTADVVVHAINPPYTEWRKQAQPLLDQSIAIAKHLGATLMLPGNVYNYGREMTLSTRESAPQAAQTVKGKIRIEMERSLVRASEQGTRCIVVRAGDFFGAGKGSWLDLVIAKDLAKGKFTFPGALDVPHAWAYVPDLARAFVALAARCAQLPLFSTFHFEGYTLTGNDWLRGLGAMAATEGFTKSNSDLKLGGIPWGLMKLGSPFVPIWRELIEMKYLWEVPHALNGDALARALGAAPEITPFPDALRAALRELHITQS